MSIAETVTQNVGILLEQTLLVAARAQQQLSYTPSFQGFLFSVCGNPIYLKVLKLPKLVFTLNSIHLYIDKNFQSGIFCLNNQCRHITMIVNISQNAQQIVILK